MLPKFVTRALGAAFLSVICASAFGAKFDDRFAVVLINQETEARYGQIPLKRSYLARALRRVTEVGGRGVVLKFFLDQGKDVNEDALLAAEFSRIPVLLQARFDDSEPHPNPLPRRFVLPAHVPTAVNAISGWIPLPAFSNAAADIGFVDMTGTAMPLVEQYHGQSVKSLALAAIEFAEGSRADFGSAGIIRVGHGRIRVDVLNASMARPQQGSSLRSIAFHDLLDGRGNMAELRGKVVIIAYDGLHIPIVETSAGRMGAHLAFIAWLRAIYDDAFVGAKAQ